MRAAWQTVCMNVNERNDLGLLRPHTVPALARTYGIGQGKVLGWIASGELRAINCAAKDGGHPRWRILPEDLAAFESRRASRATGDAEVTDDR